MAVGQLTMRVAAPWAFGLCVTRRRLRRSPGHVAQQVHDLHARLRSAPVGSSASRISKGR